MQAAQPRAQLLAHARVERAEGLVQQEHLGLHGQRLGERHALALAARELARVAAGEALELHQGDQLVDAVADLALDRRRIVSPKAMFSRTVMCLKAA